MDEFLSQMSSAFHADILGSDLRAGQYWDNIEKWSTALGNRMLVVSTEELKERPAMVLARICGFLGIENVYEDYHFESFQKGYIVRSDGLHRTLRRILKFDPMEYGNFAREHSHFHPLRKGPLRKTLELAYARFQHRPVTYSEQALALLREYYAPHNRILADRVGIDYTVRPEVSQSGIVKLTGVGLQSSELAGDAKGARLEVGQGAS